ncbi:serine/threonine-protein phosphatase BSL1-like isoform X2 [Olea europaea var. sylvestris]|uniref:serine/threonine-protein phosphatase BSL1-like isoform X2 n=1 Tax=Olea europaea var. sylvestris TaxID=158386 RepID=UPI000C1D827D|nr:serine/threonine-protein phosphatase BSL1-like isoform X2 [Olea europaea var. sylvestris]
MGSKPWLYPAPTYRPLEAYWDGDEDAPGPRCGHTLTAVAATKTHGPRLILFGGTTAIEGGNDGAPGIRLAGVTNSVHSYDVLTRKWIRLQPAGDPPSPRAAHAAAAVGTIVVFQGGIGPAGHSTDDLYVLDMTNDKFKWHRVVVQGLGPGPRYGHVMDLVAQRYLVTVSGNDGEELSETGCTQGPERVPSANEETIGKRVLSDAWALNTAQKPYMWQRLNPEGDKPSARMYKKMITDKVKSHIMYILRNCRLLFNCTSMLLEKLSQVKYATASARSDGMFLLCGGRDTSSTPLADAYGLLMHRNGQWEWTPAPGVSPSPRYQHAAVFVGARLHVTGGALRGGRAVEGEAAIAVLDTAAGVWIDRNGMVTSRSNKGQAGHDPSLELMRRCRHAAASVGVRIYVYGGLKGDTLFNDLLVAENSPFQSDANSLVTPSDRALTTTNLTSNASLTSYSPTTTHNGRSEIPSSGGLSMNKNSMEKLAEASAAEAEAANAVWQAAKAASATPEETSLSDDTSQAAETTSEGGDSEADVRLHPRAVVVAKEAVGNLGGMVRQLSLDQFENESRRMIPLHNDLSHPTKKFTRQKSPQGLHKKIISTLLRPRNWKPPSNRKFFLDSYEVGELCYAAEQIFMQEPTVLQLKAPVKVFGDLHGQFGDLMRLFDEYGFPSTAGDVTYIDYLFLGDYVDRGQHSLGLLNCLRSLSNIVSSYFQFSKYKFSPVGGHISC